MGSIENVESFKYRQILLENLELILKKEMTQGHHLSFEKLLFKLYPFSGLEESDVPHEVKEELFLWYQNVYELSWLKDLVSDPDLKEIIIHSQRTYHYEKHGHLIAKNFDSNPPQNLELSLEVLSLKNQINWSFSHPFKSFFISFENSFFRATLSHFSISSQESSKIFLRKIENHYFHFSHFEILNDLEEQLKDLVLTKRNILISGSTSSGKTSFMSVLLSQIESHEHVIIMEDTHEIKLERPQWTQLLSQEDISGKNLKDYCAYALRMRPDRIIVGELRSKEIVPFILAMNTGHSGLMSTIHADSAKDAILRSALLFSIFTDQEGLGFDKILKLISQNIHYVIHMEKRRVKEIIEVLGSETDQIYYNQILPKKESSQAFL